MREANEESETARRLRAYVAVALALIVLALASFLIVPRGNSVRSCQQLVFASSKYACLTSLALSSRNSSVCGYAQGAYADSCYAQLAEKTNNTATCNRVQNGTVFSACVVAIASANNNYAACGSAAEPYASRCVDSIALRLNSQTICARVSNSTLSLECTSILGIRNAERTGSASYCRSVTNSTSKSVANFIIANFSHSANTSASSQSSFLLGYLYLLPNVTYTARDYCYITLATQNSNSSLCGFVSAGQARNLCTAQSGARVSSNATVNYTALLASCAKAGSYAQQCTQSVTLAQAVKTRNATLCGGLGSALSTSCYSLLASTYKNATYCSYISDPSAKSSCVSNA